jgi:DNA-binding MarR family transcriptional regulator
MHSKDLRILHILEHIERKKDLSQRYLSKKMGISLGLVNSLLKRMEDEGYLKAETNSNNRTEYSLTPRGFTEKTRLTYEYVNSSYQFYKDAKRRLYQVFNEIGKSGMKNIVFYGASDLADFAYLSLKETPLQLKTIVCESRSGKTFWGMPIEDPAALEQMTFDAVLITATGLPDRTIDHLLRRGIDRKKILTF